MTRTMFDSITPSTIPADAEMVAGYVNGYWPTFADVCQRFPNARHVSIAVTVVADAQVLDVEPGNARPDQAPAWVERQRARGGDPTVYCMQSAWPELRAEFSRQGVVEPHWWLAKYDGLRIIPEGAIAKQYGGESGPGYDLNVVADYWPGVDPAPSEGVDMPRPSDVVAELDCPTGGVWRLTYDGGVRAEGGAPFYGSYPGLPPEAKQDDDGWRGFWIIKPLGRGYRLTSTEGYRYDFPAA